MGDFTKEYWPSEHDPGLDAARLSNNASHAPNQSHIDPLAVTPSALAHGQIGRVAWALVERGDGLILALGDVNVPIDTAKEGLAAIDMARAVELHILLGDRLKVVDSVEVFIADAEGDPK